MLYNNVRLICKAKKISISQIERDLGYARSSMCKWNDNVPSVAKVQRVADYLNVSIEELLSCDDMRSEL